MIAIKVAVILEVFDSVDTAVVEAITFTKPL